MKQVLLFLLVFCAFGVRGQVITTVAGNGTFGFSGDAGPATLAKIGYPDGCAFDSKGNLYFTQVGDERVRKISPTGIISTIAGTGISGYNGDGIAATAAQLNLPTGIAIDKYDNIYISDGNNFRIRKIDITSGTITTIAGNGISSYSGDGIAATLTSIGPEDLCIDSAGNIYVADFVNFRIRKIDRSGIITTYVGSGISGYSGDNGSATLAKIEQVYGLCIDKLGNLFFTQNASLKIRKVNSSGIISTYAGNGLLGPSGDGGPATTAGLGMVRLVTDNYGNLYISGYVDNDIRIINKDGIINTIAGTGVYGYSGDGGSASMASFSTTFGITLDTCGNLYIADKANFRIRKVTYPKCNYLAVEEPQSNNPITIHPNPATSTLQVDNIKTTTQYQLYNMLASSILQGTLKPGNNTLPMEAIEPGIYMLALINEEGEKTVHKVVKE